MFNILICKGDIHTLSEKVFKCILGLLYSFFFFSYSSTWETFEKQDYRIDIHITFLRYMYTVLLSLLHPALLNSACSIQSE